MTAPADRTGWAAAACGVLAAAVAFAVALRADPSGAWRLVLANVLFWSGVAAGASVFAALLSLTGARWDGPIRALASGCSGFLPLACVLLVVLAPGMPRIFGVPGPGEHALAWIAIRDAIGLAAFYGVCVRFIRHPHGSSASLVVLVFVGVWSLLAIDLIMRLDRQWVSTLFPAYVAVTNLYAGIAGTAVMAAFAPRAGVLPRLDASRARDLGRLLLGCSLLWLYVFWSQFLVIWYGNLPGEFGFLIDRTRGGWQAIAILVLVCCAGIPTVLLIARRTRRVVGIAAAIALAGVWFERLLLVFPPYTWRGSNTVVASVIALGFAAGFLRSIPRS